MDCSPGCPFSGQQGQDDKTQELCDVRRTVSLQIVQGRDQGGDG